MLGAEITIVLKMTFLLLFTIIAHGEVYLFTFWPENVENHCSTLRLCQLVFCVFSLSGKSVLLPDINQPQLSVFFIQLGRLINICR